MPLTDNEISEELANDQGELMGDIIKLQRGQRQIKVGV